MSNLAETLPEEQRRVREEVLPQYEQLRGIPGVSVEFAILTIKASLTHAEHAASSGNIADMAKALENLRSIE
jgi:hypothetical protein